MSSPYPTEMGSLHRGATSLIWDGAQPLNIEKLWSPAPIEGENHEHPGVHGRLPREKFLGEQEVDIDYHLSTLTMPNGSAAANPAAGALANYRQLITRVGNPITWGGAATSITVIDSLGQTYQGDVQMSVSPLGVRSGSVVPCTLTIIIPAGELELVSS